MPRFFVEDKPQDIAIITGDDAFHIGRSLRMKTGDKIILCHNGCDYFGKIARITDSQVFVEIEYSAPSESEPTINVTLFQALPKMDKLEFITQKAVELGVTRIVPVMTSRCVSRPDIKSFEKKLVRLNKISESAAKQCGRGIIPTVSGIINLNDVAKQLCEYDVAVICYEKGGVSLSQLDFSAAKNVAVIIGSEGGFERDEVLKLTSNGATSVSLGKRILRCETAPLAVLSITMNLTGNM